MERLSRACTLVEPAAGTAFLSHRQNGLHRKPLLCMVTGDGIEPPTRDLQSNDLRVFLAQPLTGVDWLNC